MSETKFTQGPWVAEKPRWYAPTDERHVYDTQGQLIARIPLAGRFQSVNEAKANAHLIAAAPDMYEVIEEIAGMKITDCDAHDAANYMRDAARALLAKMRGEA